MLLMIRVGPVLEGTLAVAVFGSAEAPGAVVPSGLEMPVLVLLLDMLRT